MVEAQVLTLDSKYGPTHDYKTSSHHLTTFMQLNQLLLIAVTAKLAIKCQ